MPALLLLTGPSAGLRFEFTTVATLGRSPSCEIPLEDEKVSGRHARIAVVDGQIRISDLGSPGGTRVNGEGIDAEAALLPGDFVQLGETTAVVEASCPVTFEDSGSAREPAGPQSEALLPRVDGEAVLYSLSVALLGAGSEAMVLRRAAEETLRCFAADRAAAVLGGPEGLRHAAVVGVESVRVPRSLARAAVERNEAGSLGTAAVAPMAASGGAPFGVLFAERERAWGAGEIELLSALGRLTGEACAAARTRSGPVRPPPALVGASARFRKMAELARRAAASKVPVLLHGEAGTGRGHLAAWIHACSSRAEGPRVEVDARRGAHAVQELLFGSASAPGIPPLPSAVRRAEGGTLVIRNVDLLTRWQGGRLAELLSAGPDVRLIATASEPLEALEAKGELVPELTLALSGMQVEVVPLRERRADVEALFDHFARQAPGSIPGQSPTLSPDARRLLAGYGWPGNVGELRQVTERLASLYAGGEITALTLPPEIQEGTVARAARNLQSMIQRLERDAISEALREARGKKIKAAALLGISRPTLDKKIDDYGLVVDKRRS